MQIEGSVEDELFNIDKNKTLKEFMADAAANPTKSYVATIPSWMFSINILHCQNKEKSLTAARLNANAYYQQNQVKREESLNQLAVTRSNLEDAKRVLASLLEEGGVLSLAFRRRRSDHGANSDTKRLSLWILTTLQGNLSPS
jgi:hypothetical protein